MSNTTTSRIEGHEVQEQQVQEQQEPQNLPDFQEWIKEKPKTGYVKLEYNVPKTLHFKSGKGEMSYTDMGGKLDEKIPVAKFVVTTPEEPNNEQEFDVTSKRLAATINANYERGFANLEITKQNTTPVSYLVIPAAAREAQRKF
jgi:hypothetical protein